MLFKWLPTLSDKLIILASGSPRRKEILESINLKIKVTPSTFEENLTPSDFNSIPDYVTETANRKASGVASLPSSEGAELIIAADTMVVLDGEMMGKPGNKQAAIQMLKRLSQRTHTVYTGVTLIWPKTNHKIKFCESTEVTFASLTDDIIEAYVSTNEPLDKAGAYGIQSLGATLIQSIKGDFYTVMGLPLHKFSYHLNNYYITN